MKPELLMRAQCPDSPNINSNNNINNNSTNNCELLLQQDDGSNSSNNNIPQQPHLLMAALSVIEETEIVTSPKSSDPIAMTSSHLVLNCPIDEEVGTPTNCDVFGATKPRVVMTLGSDDEDETNSDANVTQGLNFVSFDSSTKLDQVMIPVLLCKTI